MNRKNHKKILWLCHWESPYEEEWRGGMGKYMYKLADELNRDFGIEIDIITPNFSDYPSKQPLSPGINLFRLDVPANGNIRNQQDMEEYAKGVNEFIKGKEKDYSLVHAHYWSSFIAGEELSNKGLPYILQLHQLQKPMERTFSELGLEYIPLEWRIEQEKRSVENADKTIFVSNTQLIEFEKEYYNNKIPRDIKKRIEVILNGVDVNAFKPVGREELRALKEKHGLPADSFVISYCGRLDPDKAVDRLLYSIHSFLEKYYKNPFKVIITGKGSDINYYEGVVKNLNLEDTIEFHGYHTGDSLIERFQIGDVGVVTSIHETFGLSVIEFMACGKPVIVWKGSGGPEEIINNSSGVIVGDYREMTNSLYELATNNRLRKKIGEEARKKSVEVYNWDRVAKEVNRVYTELL